MEKLFVVRRGDDEVVPLSYSYSRRAQSTVRTLQWRDVAAMRCSSVGEALEEFQKCIADWSRYPHLQGCRWQLEARFGKYPVWEWHSWGIEKIREID